MLETPVKQSIPHGAKTEGENLADRDNQQVTCLTEVELAWLAGFLDADGMIRLHRGAKNSNKGQRSFVAKVSFTNTCGLTVKELCRKLGVLGVKHQIHVKNKGDRFWKPGVDVVVMHTPQVHPLLTALLPYLVTKQLEAQIVLEFLERRRNRLSKNTPYCERDYLAFAALAFLKQTRHLRDFTPSVEDVLGQDKVRTSAEALEAAETSARLSDAQIQERGSRLVLHRWNKDKALPVDFKALKSCK